MATVHLEMGEYRSMERRQEASDKKIRALIDDMNNLEEDFRKKLNDFRDKKSVLIVMQGYDGEIIGSCNFDEIKEKVEKDFIKGKYDKELSELKQRTIKRTIEERDTLKRENVDLQREIDRLKNLSFFERLFKIYD